VALETSGPRTEFDNKWTPQRIQRCRERLEVQNIKSISVALLSTSAAVKFLRRTTRTTQSFPDGYLAADTVAVDHASKTMLASYASELLHLELAAAASPLPLARLIAAGFGILANSIEAVAQGSMISLQEGRQLWNVLLRGLPAFSQTYREIMNPDASDEDIACDLFVPIILVPHWPLRSNSLQREHSVQDDRSGSGALGNESATPTCQQERKSIEDNLLNKPGQATLRSGFRANPLSTRVHSGTDTQEALSASTPVAQDHPLTSTAKCNQSEDQVLNNIRSALISSE
jgi:hypothetical protein